MVNNSVKSLSRRALVPIFAIAMFGCGGSDTTTDTQIVEIDLTQPVSSWELVWSDEFDGDSIDLNNWTHEVNCAGGGNQEKQCYTDDPANSYVSDGFLNIVALPAGEDAQLPYTSARLNTKNKQDFTYGRFEMRAKLPSGQGTWPAFWMLFTDGVYGETWPTSGEIDIMEAVNLGEPKPDGGVQTDIFGTLYYGELFPNQSQSGKAYTPPDGVNPADDFHTYAVEWQEGEIRWYMDGYLYATQRKSDVRLNSQGEAIGLRHRGWFVPGFDPVTGEEKNFYEAGPFDEDFYIILNLAVGGNFPENFNRGGIDPAVFENGQTYQIDYVRVYECSIDPITGRGCETLRPGYDDLEDALVEGVAPSPTPPVPPTAIPITIFDNGEDSAWPLWDCCGGTTPEVVMDDPEYGSVVEFRINDNAGTVLGFNSRLGDGQPYNGSAMNGIGSLSFDMKVVSQPTAPTTWLVKVEADNNTSFAEFPLEASVEGAVPVEGQWQTYTFPIQQLVDAGLDAGSIDVIMIFPLWQTGEGAIYRVDNVKIAEDNGGGQVFPELVLFEDEQNLDWSLWDCCGGTTPTEVQDDPEYGTVARFEILDNAGTVLGFNGRQNGAVFDASSLLSVGVLQFDMKVVSPPAETTWLLKVEADGNTSFAEVPLNTSNEGLDPVTGEWQTYTFDLLTLSDAGLDVSAIDIVMIFPAWQTGAGAVYHVDNAKIYNPNATSGGPSGPLLEVFADAPNPGWPAWDCCGGTTPTIEMDDAQYGAVTEFRINDNAGTVLGFYSRDAGEPFDASAILTTGVVQFDMKLVSPTASDTTWLMKIEADGNTSFAEVPLNTSQEGMDPVVGEWQTYTFDLLSLSDAGLDVSAIDVLMVFPLWQTGAGAVYRIDNFYIGNPSDISGGMTGGDSGVPNAAMTIFADQINEGWPLWDCCGGTTPTVETDDAEHGATAEFRINDNAGTVLGFYSRDAGMPYNAEALIGSGKFQFEMKLVSAPSADTTWLLKIEADGNTSFAELPLSDSLEGMEPTVGEWQTYTFDLLALADAGLDLTAIDVIMVFPLWQTGAGAVYRLDNVVFTEN
jgi:beta-glucanase (GH16 family)